MYLFIGIRVGPTDILTAVEVCLVYSVAVLTSFLLRSVTSDIIIIIIIIQHLYSAIVSYAGCRGAYICGALDKHLHYLLTYLFEIIKAHVLYASARVSDR